MSAYEKIGGVVQALANHAEDVYNNLDAKEQAQARRVLVQLFYPGETPTRRLATENEIGTDNWAGVKKLADKRLVVTNEREQAKTVEIIHESLIFHWPRFGGWIRADQKFRLWQEELRAALKKYKNTGYDSDALLRGVVLAEAEKWLDEMREDIGTEEQKFIHISVTIQKEETEKNKQQQQKLQDLNERLRHQEEVFESLKKADSANDVEESLEELKKTLQVDPNNPIIHRKIGDNYFQKKEFAKAREFYDSTIELQRELSQEPAKAYYQRGRTFREMGDHKNAMTDFDKAIALDPQYTRVYSSRALLHAKEGKWVNAITDITKAVEQVPDDFVYLYNRADIYEMAEEFEKAKMDYIKLQLLLWPKIKKFRIFGTVLFLFVIGYFAALLTEGSIKEIIGGIIGILVGITLLVWLSLQIPNAINKLSWFEREKYFRKIKKSMAKCVKSASKEI